MRRNSTLFYLVTLIGHLYLTSFFPHNALSFPFSPPCICVRLVSVYFAVSKCLLSKVYLHSLLTPRLDLLCGLESFFFFSKTRRSPLRAKYLLFVPCLPLRSVSINPAPSLETPLLFSLSVERGLVPYVPCGLWRCKHSFSSDAR